MRLRRNCATGLRSVATVVIVAAPRSTWSPTAVLDRVAVEQRLGLALSLLYQGELPGEVEGVLHAGVHALAAGRAVDVGRVAREHHPAAPIVGHLAFVDAEAGQPDRIGQGQPAGPALVRLWPARRPAWDRAGERPRPARRRR